MELSKCFRINEQILKSNLKNKRSITLGLIVSYLISGNLGGFVENKIFARDLRSRSREENNIRPDRDGPQMGTSANGMDVVNINNPNSGGISHNKFIDFNVGSENGAIFNNNSTKDPYVSKIGGIVAQNPHLKNSASTILSEVTGNKISSINGMIEVAGRKADFVLANENGISINGGGFLNTSGVTLTTGRPIINNSNIDFDVTKGNISIEKGGLGTSGDFFNIISKTIELRGKVSASDAKDSGSNITLLAGQNKVNLEKGQIKSYKTIGNQKDSSEKYGIYADNLGAMYGKNIRLISTTQGLGVKHEGVVNSLENIEILSNGDIDVSSLVANKKVKVEGEGNLKLSLGKEIELITPDGISVLSNNLISGTTGVDIKMKGNVEINSRVSSGGNVNIDAQNLILKKGETARISIDGNLVIKTVGDTIIEEIFEPVKLVGATKFPLVVLKDKDGNLIVKDPETDKILSPNEIKWVSTGIVSNFVDINADKIINDSFIEAKKDMMITSNQLINNKLIVAQDNLQIKSQNIENNKDSVIRGKSLSIKTTNLTNKGELRQNNKKEGGNPRGTFEVDIKNGSLINSGIVSGYVVVIKGTGFILNEVNGKIEASSEDFPKGTGTINITSESLTNKGTIQAHGGGRSNNITIDTKQLSNAFGAKIIVQKGELQITTSVGDLLNSGEIFADKDIALRSAKNIKNSGKIGGENITITTESGGFENYGKVAANKNLMIHVNNLINAGTPEEISKYLAAFNYFVQENYENVKKTIDQLENKIKLETNASKLEGLRESLKYYRNLELELSSLKYDIDRVGSLGILSGEKVDISFGTEVKNNGIIKSKTAISISQKSGVKNGIISNNGAIEGETDVTLTTDGNIVNTQRIYAGKNLSVTANSFKSSGGETEVEKYVELMSKYDEKKLEEAENKVKELEALLEKSKDITEVDRLKLELNKYRAIKDEQAKYKAQIITIKGLGTIEAGNIKIETINKIQNDGIIRAKSDLLLKVASGDITNNSHMSAGENVTIEGNSFINNVLTAGKEFVGKVSGIFNSESLTVGGNANIEANQAIIEKDLSVGENTTINLKGTNAEIIFDSNSKGNLEKNLSVNGGSFTNKGEILVGEKVDVDTTSNSSTKNKYFINSGILEIKGDLNIKSEGLGNTGSINTGSNLSVDAGTGKITNTNKIQAAEDGGFKSEGFFNEGSIVLGGNVNLNSGKGNVENKSLEAKKSINIETLGDIINTEKLNTAGELSVKGNNFTNGINAEIVNSKTSIDLIGNLLNQGNLESTGKINIKGSNLNNSGNIKTTENGILDIKNNISNSGEIGVGKELAIKTGSLTNNKKIHAGELLDIEVTKDLKNESGAEILSKKIIITGDKAKDGSIFSNQGNIISNTTLDINYGTKDVDIIFKDDGKIRSEELMKVKTGGAIINESRFQNKGSLDFNAGTEFINKAMVVSNGDIKIGSLNIINDMGASIWAAKNLVLEAVEKIYNKLSAVLESKGNMTITASHLLNEAGIIKAGGDLTINADKVENISSIKGTGYKQVGETIAYGRFKYFHGAFKEYAEVTITIPKFESDIIVSDVATIQSNGNVVINGKKGKDSKSNVTNDTGMISSGKNMSIIGNLKNETRTASMTIDEYMSKIKITVKKQVYTIGDLPIAGWKKWEYDNLYRALKEKPGDYDGFITAMKIAISENETLKTLMNTAMPNWATNNLNMNEYNGTSKSYFYPSQKAQLIAGGNFSHTGGTFENTTGEKVENKKIDITIGENSIEGTQANLGVSVKDPNSITEVDGVKQVHNVEIQTGSVTINGVTISAGSGGGIGSIAVAGTINPIIFIDIPVGNNGIFKPTSPKPDGTVDYLFETNIDFIDVSKYYGSDYFFKQIGYDKNTTSTVIGDAYYEQQLINNSIKQGLGYAGEVNTDQIKIMLDNALDIKDELGLDMGKPLTPEQINKLENDIVWYVEMEVQGQIVLVPQVYFGKETRLKMSAADTGGGLGSTVKANGDITIDAENVINSNGSISSSGNIIINSENDIINNSAGGVGGGINATGHVALDAEKNVEMIGGNVKGDVVIVDAGNDVIIESTLKYDEQGNQIIGDVGGINAESGIVISAGNDVNMKSASLKVNGKDLTEKEPENSTDKDSKNEDSTTEPTQNEAKKTEVVKDTAYYKELFAKKDVTEIIGGPVGSINIDAGNNVNIGDLNVVKSDTKVNEDGYTQTLTTTSSSTSQGSDVYAETINISAKNNVNIIGSNIGKEPEIEALENVIEKSEESAEKPKANGGITITAGNNVNILDGQNVSSTTIESNTKDIVFSENEKLVVDTTKSKGSSILSDSSISITAGEGDVKVVGGNISGDDVVVSAIKGNVKFEAGKNTEKVSHTKTASGIVNKGAAAGLSGNFGENFKNIGNKGKLQQDNVAAGDVLFGSSSYQKDSSKTEWNEVELSSKGNIIINAGNTVDIGGVNIGAKEDVLVKGKKVETTKYVDTYEENIKESSTGVKLTGNVTSNVASAINGGKEIDDRINNSVGGQHETGAINAAQGVSIAANAVLNDALAVNGGVSISHSSSETNTKTTEENITTIKGNNVTIQSTEGDINLAGVNIKGSKGVLLDSAKELNISSAKKTQESSYTNNNLEIGIGAYAGGGATGGGAAINASVSNSHASGESSSLIHTNSQISGENIIIKSSGDTNIVGGLVNGTNVKTIIGGNLNIETVKDTYSKTDTESNVGVEISVGADVMGPLGGGVNVGGGETWANGETIGQQSGIVASGQLDINAEGNLNLKGGVVASESNQGSLNIGGEIKHEDVVANEKSGGGTGGVSIGGGAGGANVGIYGSVGDLLDQTTTAQSTISGIIDSNKDLGDINTDLKSSMETVTDVKVAGGSFGFGTPTNVGKKPTQTTSGNSSTSNGNSQTTSGNSSTSNGNSQTTSGNSSISNSNTQVRPQLDSDADFRFGLGESNQEFNGYGDKATLSELHGKFLQLKDDPYMSSSEKETLAQNLIKEYQEQGKVVITNQGDYTGPMGNPQIGTGSSHIINPVFDGFKWDGN